MRAGRGLAGTLFGRAQTEIARAAVGYPLIMQATGTAWAGDRCAAQLNTRRVITMAVIAVAAAGLVACGSPPVARARPPVTAGPTSTSAIGPPGNGGAGDREMLDAHSGCGTERWSIKTGSDPDAGLINLNAPPTQTTVGALSALIPPNPIPPEHRVQPVETTLYQLSATLTGFKLEADSDYHLVLSDGNRTMIAELASPSCTQPDLLREGITGARHAFDSRFQPTSSFQHLNVPVTITGVGFFDFIHGQTGVAPNGIELHPVLSITFG